MAKSYSVVAIFAIVLGFSNNGISAEVAKDLESISGQRNSTCSSVALNTAVCTIVVIKASDSVMIGPTHCLKPVANHYQVTEGDLIKKIIDVIQAVCGSGK